MNNEEISFAIEISNSNELAIKKFQNKSFTRIIGGIVTNFDFVYGMSIGSTKNNNNRLKIRNKSTRYKNIITSLKKVSANDNISKLKKFLYIKEKQLKKLRFNLANKTSKIIQFFPKYVNSIPIFIGKVSGTSFGLAFAGIGAGLAIPALLISTCMLYPLDKLHNKLVMIENVSPLHLQTGRINSSNGSMYSKLPSVKIIHEGGNHNDDNITQLINFYISITVLINPYILDYIIIKNFSKQINVNNNKNNATFDKLISYCTTGVVNTASQEANLKTEMYKLNDTITSIWIIINDKYINHIIYNDSNKKISIINYNSEKGPVYFDFKNNNLELTSGYILGKDSMLQSLEVLEGLDINTFFTNKEIVETFTIFRNLLQL